MNIRRLLEPRRALCNVEARSKKHTLDILSELLASGEAEITHTEIFDSLVNREKLGCTALGQGVAIPHARVLGLEGNLGAFLKLSQPVEFDSPDGEPVDLVFALLIPEDCGDAHLDTLARIASAFRDSQFRELLREASSSRGLYDLLIHYDPHRSASA